MQHVKMADKSLLIGDAVTDLLLDYSALLGRVGSADAVKVNAISGDGDMVVAGLLLNQGTVLVSETTRSSLAEPDNAQLEAYLTSRINSYRIEDASPFGLEDLPAADTVS